MTVLKSILEALTRIPGVRSAALVSRDGFVIDVATRAGELDPEAVGAVISSGVGFAEKLGRELMTGDLTQMMLEFDEGIIIVSLIEDDAILAVTAEVQVNLGSLRYQVKKAVPQLAGAI